MDKKATKILLKWDWESPDQLSQEDFEYAKNAGVMFDDSATTHDELVKRGRSVIQNISLSQVVDAFLSSLSSRRLDLRSALGSWVYLSNMPNHSHKGPGHSCNVCGRSDHPTRKLDWNSMNFERIKWGGVRHDDLAYAAFDLEQFLKLKVEPPTETDFSIMRDVIHSLDHVGGDVVAATAHKHLPSCFKSNKTERMVLLDILGLCGIFNTGEHCGYLNSFNNYVDRAIPSRRFVEQPYPFCWWNGTDGLNDESITKLFGHALYRKKE